MTAKARALSKMQGQRKREDANCKARHAQLRERQRGAGGVFGPGVVSGEKAGHTGTEHAHNDLNLMRRMAGAAAKRRLLDRKEAKRTDDCGTRTHAPKDRRVIAQPEDGGLSHFPKSPVLLKSRI